MGIDAVPGFYGTGNLIDLMKNLFLHLFQVVLRKGDGKDVEIVGIDPVDLGSISFFL